MGYEIELFGNFRLDLGNGFGFGLASEGRGCLAEAEN